MNARFFFFLSLVSLASAAPAPSAPPSSRKAGSGTGGGFSLLPKSLQRQPVLDFNIITEMTREGAKRPVPTADKPVYYALQPGKYTKLGMDSDGTAKTPPVPVLQRAMERSLAESGFRPAAEGRPGDIAVVFNFGSFPRFDNSQEEAIEENIAQAKYEDAAFEAATRGLEPPAAPPIRPPNDSAEELLPYVLADLTKRRDVVERASIVGGTNFALALSKAINDEVVYRQGKPAGDSFGGPFRRFQDANAKSLHLVEQSFTGCYFVIASAYDYAALNQGKRVLLWRTKMTVASNGVSVMETLPALIASAGPYLGREMKEAEITSRRLTREGRVEVGTPIVVEDPVNEPRKTK